MSQSQPSESAKLIWYVLREREIERERDPRDSRKESWEGERYAKLTLSVRTTLREGERGKSFFSIDQLAMCIRMYLPGMAI